MEEKEEKKGVPLPSRDSLNHIDLCPHFAVSLAIASMWCSRYTAPDTLLVPKKKSDTVLTCAATQWMPYSGYSGFPDLLWRNIWLCLGSIVLVLQSTVSKNHKVTLDSCSCSCLWVQCHWPHPGLITARPVKSRDHLNGACETKAKRSQKVRHHPKKFRKR